MNELVKKDWQHARGYNKGPRMEEPVLVNPGGSYHQPVEASAMSSEYSSSSEDDEDYANFDEECANSMQGSDMSLVSASFGVKALSLSSERRDWDRNTSGLNRLYEKVNGVTKVIMSCY